MFGFIFGTVCLVLLINVLRRGHRWRRDDRGRGFGRRWVLRRFFERLDTTPGQEKAIVGALDGLRENRQAFRDELKQTRLALARAVESGRVDESSLAETFAQQDRLLATVRASFVQALKKATEALDERQRKQASDLIESGGLLGRGHGPHRMWA